MRRRRHGNPSFDEALHGARQQEPWAFQHLFELVVRQLVAYARSHGAWDPDGIANEVLVGAFRRIGEFRGTESGFRAWVFTIARSRLIDERRARARRPMLVEEAAERNEPIGNVEEDVWAELGTDRVEEVLASLSEDQREVLLLRVVADLTCDEVAAALGKSSEAVKALQHRAIATLRRRLAAGTENSPEAVSLSGVFDGSLVDGARAAR